MAPSNETTSPDSGLIRQAGASGVGAMFLILTFATINGRIGGLFAREVVLGEPIDPWIDRIRAQPTLAEAGMLSAGLGFSLLFVFGITLCRLLPRDDWRSTLAMTGYLLGAPSAVYSFMAAGCASGR